MGARLETRQVGDFTGASSPGHDAVSSWALAPEVLCLAFRAHALARPGAFEPRLAFQAVAELRLLRRLVFGLPEIVALMMTGPGHVIRYSSNDPSNWAR